MFKWIAIILYLFLWENTFTHPLLLGHSIGRGKLGSIRCESPEIPNKPTVFMVRLFTWRAGAVFTLVSAHPAGVRSLTGATFSGLERSEMEETTGEPSRDLRACVLTAKVSFYIWFNIRHNSTISGVSFLC